VNTKHLGKRYLIANTKDIVTTKFHGIAELYLLQTNHIVTVVGIVIPLGDAAFVDVP
jgi:hypothetical protein